jgi:predicted hotdog family 3-hydroxylacyl-ACP dehydratase
VLNRDEIAALVPHTGSMCLLDRVLSWTPREIVCATRTHLDLANPLRRKDRLATICALEYAFQAAAVHGALRDGRPQPAGYVATLRNVTVRTARLDDPRHGELRVTATLERDESAGLIYALRVASERAVMLVEGRAAIALPRPA